MNEVSALETLAAVGSIATPLVVLLLTAVGWRYRQAIERRAALEEKLRDDRIEIYNKKLEPFIILLISDTAWQYDKKNKNRNKTDAATSIFYSLEYRTNSFKLSLIGSDDVVTAFNNLMQHFYAHQEETGESIDVKTTLDFLGKFLLEIRKSMGNESAKIDQWGMLEWFITEARKMR